MAAIREESLLTRWSRRKQQTQEQSRLEDQASIAGDLELSELSPAAELASEAATQEQRPELLTDADMPPLESLNEESDFSVFMSAGVSDQLRNLALRKLFQSPSFNIQDGLDDYNDDYTTFEKLGDIVTCDMKHQIEMEAKKKLEQEAEKLVQQETAASVEAATEHDPVLLVEPAAATQTQLDDATASTDTETIPITEAIHE